MVPAPTFRQTASLARRRPKDLVIESSSTAGGAAAVRGAVGGEGRKVWVEAGEVSRVARPTRRGERFYSVGTRIVPAAISARRASTFWRTSSGIRARLFASYT